MEADRCRTVPHTLRSDQLTLQSKKTIRILFHLFVWLIVAWGVWRAARKSMEQLDAQRQSIQTQAAELDSQADALGGQNADSNEIDQASLAKSKSLRTEAEQLRGQERNFFQADWRFLALGCLIYSLAMIPTASYWLLCLAAMGQNVPWQPALWAYFYGNLGKYVPGKAMVVVLRVAEISRWGGKKVATTLTVFMETLSTMAVGGAVAAVCVMALNLDWRISAGSLGLLVATVVPTAPGLLRLALRKLQPGVPAETIAEWTNRLNWQLTLKGWAILSLTWLGYGLSLGCILYGLHSTQWLVASPIVIWLSIFAACALAVVIGFLSMLPGGAGVRELVLATVLTPVVGPTAALCCAIWLRITWLVAELMMAGLSYVLKSIGSAEPPTT